MVEVVCGIIGDGEGRYLACKRPQGKHLGGLWEFPGGKVDAGETPQIALARELMEELGIKVEVGDALEAVIWNYERGPIRLQPYFCRILEGEPAAIEHEQLLWCAAEDFAALLWADADLPVLEQLRKGLDVTPPDEG